MAILSGINTRLRGSAGDWTFSRLNGQTVAKQKVEAKENPKRTFAQMVRRVQWSNLVALYQAFEGNLHPSFKNKGVYYQLNVPRITCITRIWQAKACSDYTDILYTLNFHSKGDFYKSPRRGETIHNTVQAEGAVP